MPVAGRGTELLGWNGMNTRAHGTKSSTLLGFCLVLVAATWLCAMQARASCVPLPAQVVWSYPAEGAQDVATDALFWILA